MADPLSDDVEKQVDRTEDDPDCSITGKYDPAVSDSERIRRANRRFKEGSSTTVS